MTVAEPKATRAARAAANIERQRIKQEKAKERRKRLWAINLDRLQQAYPETFDAAHPKPLTIGCKHAIRAEFGWRASKGLGHWTHRTEYLCALAAPDAQRHSLDGTPIEPVSAEHREYAMRLLEDMRTVASLPGACAAERPQRLEQRRATS